jgi:hypothetical protein
MDSLRIVYYHYFRHHREQRDSYEVTEFEEAEARTIGNTIHDAVGLTVTSVVEHFEILPAPGSKYHQLLAAKTPTYIVMPDMRMYAQTAGVKGLRLLRDTLEAGAVPFILSEVHLMRNHSFDDWWQRKAEVIMPLTSHIDVEKPHGNGRQRTEEITSLMRSAFAEIERGRILDRDSLLAYLQSQVELRYANSAETIAVFEPAAWRTYQYKVRRRIEEMMSKTYTVLGGPQKPIRPDSVWTTDAPSQGRSVPVFLYVADACIRQLDGE